jgi:Galactose oxidase, central domain
MTTPRVHHSATELPGGRVLIAGGWAIGGGLKSAEVFDPATKTFVTTAGDMTFDHYSHSGSPLPSGRVLIAGGWSDADHGPTNVRAITYTTEIFTAATGTFAFQPQLNRLLTNRTDQTATVVAAGQLLLAGGLATGSISPTDSAETYDAGSNMFTNTANRMSRSRTLHTATLTNLPRGQVMIVGGDDHSIGPHEVDLYDPTTQRFAPAPDTIQFPTHGAHRHAAAGRAGPDRRRGPTSHDC